LLAWELSTTNDARVCVHAVERAIAEHGVPKLFNPDQRPQFTSAAGRTVKYDEVYPKSHLSFQPSTACLRLRGTG
jgi:hypothetical protein